MKDLSLLVWLSQLGMSVVFPLAGFVGAAVWLNKSCGFGAWVIWAGIVLGLVCAVNGLRYSLQVMSRIASGKQASPPPPAFNEHE